MKRELTGRHVLAITLSAFSVIVAVNLLMAYKAVGTFPGLEVANSYVASQQFDQERAAQQALGWNAHASHEDGQLRLGILDEQGLHPRIRSLAATIGRPTHVREDQVLQLTHENGVFTAPMDLGPGAWLIHVTATAPDGTGFRQRLDHIIRPGG